MICLGTRTAGPRSVGRRGPSSGDLELTCLNNRRSLPVHTTFSTSFFLQGALSVPCLRVFELP